MYLTDSDPGCSAPSWPGGRDDRIVETESGLQYSFRLGSRRFAIRIADHDPTAALTDDPDPAPRP